MPEYNYKVFDDGYDIYSGDTLLLKQRDPYGKIFIPEGSYEQNAKAHVQNLIDSYVEPGPSQEEINQANIDYLALMLDVELPNE